MDCTSGEGESIGTSEEDDDASSSVTVTSPKVMDRPTILKKEPLKPTIGTD